ncbi:MAG TPA: VIT1/CCC1 transporter family protein [Gammaproteobacteria bacterium]|nr:VIT1/CCC1 transporter family protein [Gammaproteobacteria bacterium]
MSNDLDSWQEEQQSAFLYRVIADCEPKPELRTLFVKLAEAAESQSQHWQKLLTDKGVKLPSHFHPALRARLVAQLVRWMGPQRLLPILAAMKVRGLSVYTGTRASGHDAPVAGRQETRHRHLAGGGSFRASVFGVNDGLVSNASLMLGIAGAAFNVHMILLAGIAGLLAGAASMAAGEYVSMRSQREMFEYQIGLERDELAAYPEEEAEELALIYEARGVAPAEARQLADTITRDPARALDTLAREELGLNPQELGSVWGAAISSFIAFALGALIPLIPFFWPYPRHSIAWSIGLTAVALFATGATVSLFTGRGLLWSALRMVLIGVIAAGATFLVGHLFGVALGIG